MPTAHERLSAARLVDSPALGAWCAVPSPLVAEAMGSLGFDWICLDRQHSMIDDQTALTMIQVLDGMGTPVFVRVPEGGIHAISPVLDAGATGVIVPMVETAEYAARAVDSACYPPTGQRSWGPMRHAFRPDRDAMPPNGLVMLMLETATGIDRAAQILAVPGVAGVFVGPADLAVSLGLPPSEVAHDKVLEKCATVVAICAELGLVAGIGSHSVEHARTWVEMGFGMVSIGRDVSMMRDVAADRLSQIRMTPRRPGR